ncbi:MAG TPA: APC family permease [Bryobacteraceae bacterium]|nr:APC family permease [Bryobacteraceae bacterium]
MDHAQAARTVSETRYSSEPKLRRVLTLSDLILYGLIVIQPTAPMPIFGVVSQQARGHVVTAVLIAMIAMLFTAISYGRMARVYPSAGSAYTYVGNALHPSLGYLTGWSITMDYLLNPIICTIWCSKAAQNFVPFIPYWVLACAFAVLFTLLNLGGVKTSARFNRAMVAGMSVVVLIFFGYALRFLGAHHLDAAAYLRPFYDSNTFSWSAVSRGTAIAALTYIGFDGVSTLSEEVENPRRNIMLATVLTCVITGALAAAEVYAGQLIWPDYRHYPDVDTAFVHVAGRAGGPLLFALVNLTLLVATVGSGAAAQLGAARLMFGMGRDDVIPKRFFGVLSGRGVPRNNVLFSGVLALGAALVLSYELSVELLNFGAFIAFMGVNASALVQGGNGSRWHWKNALPPVLGFAVCFYIWLSLSGTAKLVGGLWLLVGLGYGAARGSLKRRPAAIPD